MAEANHSASAQSQSQFQHPPPAPPLPPSRTVLQRIIAPLTFNIGSRVQDSQSTTSDATSPQEVGIYRSQKSQPSQTASHRTGIPITALDLNKHRTHAILAGQEILKTVHVDNGKAVEDYNLRSAINTYASTHSQRSDAVNQRREYLPAKDVRWSHGTLYDTVVATAALNGRIAIYDVNRVNSSRVELSWIHEHSGQVHKLDFDPFEGYLLLSGSQDKSVKVWDIRQRTTVLRRQNVNVRHPIRDLKWSPTDAGEFALCTESGIIQKWDIRFPSQALLSINAHEKACYSIDWHPDGRHLVSGGFDKYVRVWDLKSENRRQKPTFQLKTPQAVMNLRWRPPVWVSDLSKSGHWQSTQLATSYTDDDPRVHVWDLRRPMLPFQEIDRSSSRPTDLLWASADFLWTVGNEGMFTQTDIRYAAQVHDELPPCATSFTPSGGLVTFSEDMEFQWAPATGDPTAVFLKVTQDRLSGVSDEVVSQSVSDEEDGDDDLVISSSRQRQSRSLRSAKSLGNTPPTVDLPAVLTLEDTIAGRTDRFQNEQAGCASTIEGIAAEPELVAFLAENYARPMSAEDRKREPSSILERLQGAFSRNAAVCDEASLHRMAQSWRILGAVVVPELRIWADKNREGRLKAEIQKRAARTAEAPTAVASPNSKPPSRHTDSRSSMHQQKVMSNMFKGVVSAHPSQLDRDRSSSNLSTPLATPLPDSPHPAHQHDARFHSLSEAMDSMPPLPPSVVSAHVTAAAASKALVEDENQIMPSPPSSPEISSRPSGNSTSVTSVTQTQSPKPQPIPVGGSSTFVRNAAQMNPRTEEERRAAIRDYKAQARPLFTLEAPTQSPKHEQNPRQYSAESFAMFSASTDSSRKGKSFEPSYESSEPEPDVASVRSRPQQEYRHDLDDWQPVVAPDKVQALAEKDNREKSVAASELPDPNRKESADFVDEAPGFSFGTDGVIEQPPKAHPARPKISDSATLWNIDDLPGDGDQAHPVTVASSASEPLFQFEQTQLAPRSRIYNTNPIRRMGHQTQDIAADNYASTEPASPESVSAPGEYVHSDFRPIDLTNYEPKLPFAWSALPLICHSIAFDVVEGIACAHFAVHLLLHLHPFFFNHVSSGSLEAAPLIPEDLAERFMRPDLGPRLIESLLSSHVAYLKSMALFGPMAALRKACVEFGYPNVYKPGESEKAVGSALRQDSYLLQTSCSRCGALLPASTTVCQTCSELRAHCPVCLIRDRSTGAHSSALWTYCQACGHGGHLTCMQEWLLQPGSQGECPTSDCGCDCGPGPVREHRITRQITDAADAEIIRGPRGPSLAKRDPRKASHSPAVDKTREALRHLDLRERGSQSGDDNPRRHNHNRISSRGGSSNNNNDQHHHPLSRSGSRGGRESANSRRVRLVAPEDDGGRK